MLARTFSSALITHWDRCQLLTHLRAVVPGCLQALADITALVTPRRHLNTWTKAKILEQRWQLPDKELSLQASSFWPLLYMRLLHMAGLLASLIASPHGPVQSCFLFTAHWSILLLFLPSSGSGNYRQWRQRRPSLPIWLLYSRCYLSAWFLFVQGPSYMGQHMGRRQREMESLSHRFKRGEKMIKGTNKRYVEKTTPTI